MINKYVIISESISAQIRFIFISSYRIAVHINHTSAPLVIGANLYFLLYILLIINKNYLMSTSLSGL